MTQRHDRLCALADSLPAAIRWRYCDYEQLLKKQLQILLAPPLQLSRRRAAASPHSLKLRASVRPRRGGLPARRRPHRYCRPAPISRGPVAGRLVERAALVRYVLDGLSRASPRKRSSCSVVGNSAPIRAPAARPRAPSNNGCSLKQAVDAATRVVDLLACNRPRPGLRHRARLSRLPNRLARRLRRAAQRFARRSAACFGVSPGGAPRRRCRVCGVRGPVRTLASRSR